MIQEQANNLPAIMTRLCWNAQRGKSTHSLGRQASTVRRIRKLVERPVIFMSVCKLAGSNKEPIRSPGCRRLRPLQPNYKGDACVLPTNGFGSSTIMKTCTRFSPMTGKSAMQWWVVNPEGLAFYNETGSRLFL